MRRRRNHGPAHKVLPAEGRQKSPPKLPRRRPAWPCEHKRWWESIWRSPATEWIAADEDTLIRLAYMVELEARGQANTTLRGEIRHLEDRFGLSPMSRRKLGWEVSPDVQPHSNIRRLRAVDPDIGERRV